MTRAGVLWVGALGLTLSSCESLGPAGEPWRDRPPLPSINQAASIEADLAYRAAIYSGAVGSLVPLRCRVLDDSGHDVLAGPTVAMTTGVVTGTSCGDLRVRRSGFDTLRLSLGNAVATLPIVVAVPPIVSSPLGAPIALTGVPLPAGDPWAPSARKNSRGQLEVYFGWLVPHDATHRPYEDLHRIVSDDAGATFRYDGVVLQHDTTLCSPTGYGFENIAVVPRQDALGWRMYVAGGHFRCYGWQVFSAVSADERTWTLEGGVRLGNGSASGSWRDSLIATPYWPTGEGMAVHQLPSGGWRMLVGAYEQLTPSEDKFQIIQWESPDQLNWSYRGAVFSTRQMPVAGAGTIYSPTITEIAPGLWRMVFTGDNRPSAGWRGRLWSALSTDLATWQLEGQLLGSDGSNLSYASLAGDRLVFIRQDDGGRRTLAIATVTMP